MAQATKTAESLRISVRGVVQGVGFRPFLYQLAIKHNLTGWVCNTSGDVKIKVEGAGSSLKRFLDDLLKISPPQAHINSISITRQPAAGYHKFEIRPSKAGNDSYQLISPDLATCHACQRELLPRIC
ncbi:acylphosphatase [Chloroflexota bacterium]